MAETVADQWHDGIILADINTLFLSIVAEIRNIFLQPGKPMLACVFARCTKAGTGRIHCAVLTPSFCSRYFSPLPSCTAAGLSWI